MVALSDMSREALIRELRLATSRRDQDRAARVKRELVKRGNPLNSQKPELRTNAIAAKASTPQTRKWWEDRD